MAMLTRRSFLQTTAIAGATFPWLGSTALRAAPNDKLNFAAIGVGGKGWSDLTSIAASPHVNVVALCDIDESHDFMGRAAEKYPQAKRCSDWRKLLEDNKIDAVQVATPDHMHAPISLAAMALGKHVYVEKPLSHTVFEARAMTNAAAKAKVVTQMGNQIQSHSFYRTAVKLVQDGAIGKVKGVHSWQSGSAGWRKWTDRPEGSDPVPANVHWDLWLGVAPERPFKTGVYHAFNWRNWKDFGTGQMGDFGCHILDPVFTSLELTSPLNLTAQASESTKEVWGEKATVEFQFPATRFTTGPSIPVTWYNGGGNKPTHEVLGLPADTKLPGAGSVLIGEKGFLIIPHVGAPYLAPEEKFVDFKFEMLPNVDHYTGWADACRGVGDTTSKFSYSGPLTETVLLGNIASQFPGEKLEWNAQDLKLSKEAATALLSKSYRKGWELTQV